MKFKLNVLFGLILACLTTPSVAKTVTFKCSFQGLIPQEIVYVVNSESKDVAIVGDFGTHQGHVINYNEKFFYVLEPNLGASVATILYLYAGDTPVGVRTLLGELTDAQAAQMSDATKLSSEFHHFMAVMGKGRCPVQR